MTHSDPQAEDTAMTAPRPVSVTYASRSGGAPHVVTVLDLADGSRALSCTCKAMRSIAYRPGGCWAMKAARRILGWPEPSAEVVAEADVTFGEHADTTAAP